MEPRRRAFRLGAAFLLAVTTVSTVSAQRYWAGYATLRIVDEDRNRPVHLDVWYPAMSSEEPHNYGFGAGSVAVGASLVGTQLPVVLLSHGAMGSASNYSWIAEHLARHGYVVLGVSHFGESRVFGAESVDPAAVSRFGDRSLDLIVALDFFLQRSSYASNLDSERVALIGHSSGGASALMLAGAQFSASDLAAYCRTTSAGTDKGCLYPIAAGENSAQAPAPLDRRVAALVALDPAVGPGFTSDTLEAVDEAALIVGSVDNDFLPYAAHAGRVSARIPGAEIIGLDRGEGHFVYLDECTLQIEVMGVALCSDRPGVDRRAVHDRLAREIERFLTQQLTGG